MLDKLKYRFQRHKVSDDSIEDVYDGRLYKDFSGPGGFLSSNSNISLLGNTDGVSLIRSIIIIIIITLIWRVIHKF